MGARCAPCASALVKLLQQGGEPHAQTEADREVSDNWIAHVCIACFGAAACRRW